MTVGSTGPSPFGGFGSSIFRMMHASMTKSLSGFSAQLAEAARPQIRVSTALDNLSADATKAFSAIHADLLKAAQPQLPALTFSSGLAEAAKPLSAIHADLFKTNNQYSAQLAKAMQPQIPASIRYCGLLAGLGLSRELGELAQSFRETLRKVIEYRPVARWLDADAQARPERWPDSSAATSSQRPATRLDAALR
ncbi:hypothetical protein [Actinomadura fibrosa]|uniref:Uncharacterized protein n=1 Tax=Actinomadura fibrosa TaxID=111802 RepID=A0ABW2XMC2_9ACTN|nr:hypothetical protein [Actinomadura fibrosa]